MKKVRIVGVPEHFNLPWHLCIEEGSFEDAGIDVEWIDVPEGTGKMCQMLRAEEVDLALVLTEGIVREIASGNPSKIIQTYVESPLIWGVHSAFGQNAEELLAKPNPKMAISRYGSGSHLMSFVWAKNRGLNPNDLDFEVVHTLEGAVQALTEGKADFFLWERFTTQPYVTKKVFNRVDECPTPWPCFVLAGTSNFIKNNEATLKLILEILEPTLDEFKLIPSIDRTIASRYDLELDEVQQWMQLTQWSTRPLTIETLNIIQNQLTELGLLNKKSNFVDVVYR